MVRIFCAQTVSKHVYRAKRIQLGRGSTYEVDTDGGDVGFRVGIVSKTQEQARLSYTRVTDEEELEEVVVSAGQALVRSTW